MTKYSTHQGLCVMAWHIGGEEGRRGGGEEGKRVRGDEGKRERKEKGKRGRGKR